MLFMNIFNKWLFQICLKISPTRTNLELHAFETVYEW